MPPKLVMRAVDALGVPQREEFHRLPRRHLAEGLPLEPSACDGAAAREQAPRRANLPPASRTGHCPSALMLVRLAPARGAGIRTLSLTPSAVGAHNLLRSERGNKQKRGTGLRVAKGEEDVIALISKKNYAKAIEVLKKGKADPRAKMQLADVLVLAGKEREAVAVLVPLADEYAREGFAAKAVAVLKKIQKIDPTRRDTEQKLASLIQEKQRVATVSLPTMSAEAAACPRWASRRSGWSPRPAMDRGSSAGPEPGPRDGRGPPSWRRRFPSPSRRSRRGPCLPPRLRAAAGSGDSAPAPPLALESEPCTLDLDPPRPAARRRPVPAVPPARPRPRRGRSRAPLRGSRPAKPAAARRHRLLHRGGPPARRARGRLRGAAGRGRDRGGGRDRGRARGSRRPHDR